MTVIDFEGRDATEAALRRALERFLEAEYPNLEPEDLDLMGSEGGSVTINRDGRFSNSPIWSHGEDFAEVWIEDGELHGYTAEPADIFVVLPLPD